MTTEAKWSDFASLDGARMLAAANRLLPAWVSLLLVSLAPLLARAIDRIHRSESVSVLFDGPPEPGER